MEAYQCPDCEKTFSEERYLNRHIKSKTCTKQFICTKCNKNFSSAYNLRSHLKRKTACIPETIPIINSESDENKCVYCGKCYSSSYNLKRHSSSCPMKNNQTAFMEIMLKHMDKIEKENTSLREQLSNQVQTVVNNNNTVNIQQNNYMNVTICSFGNEDLSKLDTSKVMQLLRGQIKDFMSKMIEYIHANPEHPERHNVFYDPVRKKAIVLVPISETELSWQTRDFREVSDSLTDKIRDHVAPGNGPYFDLAMKDKDYDTSNNIINIAKHINWKTDESVEMNQNSLTTLTKNQSFMDQVQVQEPLTNT